MKSQNQISNNNSLFQHQPSFSRRYSRTSVKRVCLNDLFQDPKIQVKIPHTLMTKNILSKVRYRGPQKPIYQHNLSTSSNKLKKFEMRYQKYFQTYKSMKVDNTKELQKMNSKIMEACRELSMECVSGKGKEWKGSMMWRKHSSKLEQSGIEREREKDRMREAMSVELKPDHKDLLVSFSYFDENRKSDDKQSRSQHLSKRRASQISINSKSVKIKETEVKRPPKPRSSLNRSSKPMSNQKLQQICGWGL